MAKKRITKSDLEAELKKVKAELELLKSNRPPNELEQLLTKERNEVSDLNREMEEMECKYKKELAEKDETIGAFEEETEDFYTFYTDIKPDNLREQEIMLKFRDLFYSKEWSKMEAFLNCYELF